MHTHTRAQYKSQPRWTRGTTVLATEKSRRAAGPGRSQSAAGTEAKAMNGGSSEGQARQQGGGTGKREAAEGDGEMEEDDDEEEADDAVGAGDEKLLDGAWQPSWARNRATDDGDLVVLHARWDADGITPSQETLELVSDEEAGSGDEDGPDSGAANTATARPGSARKQKGKQEGKQGGKRGAIGMDTTMDGAADDDDEEEEAGDTDGLLSQGLDEDDTYPAVDEDDDFDEDDDGDDDDDGNDYS